MIYMWKFSIQTLMTAGKDDVFLRTYGRYLSSAKNIFQLNMNSKMSVLTMMSFITSSINRRYVKKKHFCKIDRGYRIWRQVTYFCKRKESFLISMDPSQDGRRKLNAHNWEIYRYVCLFWYKSSPVWKNVVMIVHSASNSLWYFLISVFLWQISFLCPCVQLENIYFDLLNDFIQNLIVTWIFSLVRYSYSSILKKIYIENILIIQNELFLDYWDFISTS